MIDIDHILTISSDAEFNKTALELFRYQSRCCQPYSEYIDLLGIHPENVTAVEKIPFLPIEVFKTRRVYDSDSESEAVFTSSTTGGGLPSKHFVRSLVDYERTFSAVFRKFYGNPSDYSIFALLPSYLEREGSSLVYMVDKLIQSSKNRERGGFYLYDHSGLTEALLSNKGPKILIGVTYALLDFAEKKTPLIEDLIIMETGGMKGHRKELPKVEIHKILKKSFQLDAIHSEYGMAELMSQAYSEGNGIFRTPPWMKIMVRDLNDPFEILPPGNAGGINIVDLANIHTCAFLQTQDLGRAFADDSFSISGRIDRSEVRGCNLMI